MYARQGKKAFIYAICRSYNIISGWFWLELKLEILKSNFRFSLSCLVQRSRSLYAAVLTILIRDQEGLRRRRPQVRYVFENDVELL